MYRHSGIDTATNFQIVRPSAAGMKHLVTCVIWTMPLWEKPHCDEVFYNHDFLYSGSRSLTNFVAIHYNASSGILRARVLRREACTTNAGGK